MRVRTWGDPGRGSATPVVLIHGIGVASSYMAPLGAQLEAHRVVHAIDLPGHGESEDPSRTFPAAEHARVVRDVLDAVVGTDERVVVVGHSWGCQVALEVCHQFPDRVRAGVLLAPAVDQRHDTLLRHLGGLVLLGTRQPTRLSLIEAWAYLHSGLGRTVREFRIAQHEDPLDLIRSTRLPLLLARGSKDSLVSDGWVQELTAAAPNAATADFIGASHVINWTHAPQVAAAIEHFLDQLEPRAAKERSHSRHGKLPAGSLRSMG